MSDRIYYAAPRLRDGHEDRRSRMIPEYYPGTDDRVADPFYHTACPCGYEFFRIHRTQLVTCPRCGRTFEADENSEKEKAR